MFKKITLISSCFLIIFSLAACSAPHTKIRGSENQGMILVIVEPDDAHIYIDGQDKGEVDDYDDEDSALTLPAGLHKVQIKKDGYQVFEREVFLGGGSLHEIRTTLTK